MRSRGAIWTAFYAALLCLASYGCRAGEGNCNSLYDMLSACDAGFNLTEDEFVSLCEGNRTSDETRRRVNDQIVCSVQESCHGYKRCIDAENSKQEEARQEQQCREGVTLLQKEIASQNYRDATFYCESLLKECPNNAALDSMCTDLNGDAKKTLEEELIAMRDKGDTKDLFNKCFVFEGLAKKSAAEEASKAATLCKEVKIAPSVNKLLEVAHEHVETKKNRLPFDCDFVSKKLNEIGSPWATAVLDKVLKACYIELGALILSTRVPRMRYMCEHNVRKVYEAAKRYSLKDPSIDSWLDKSKRYCARR